MRLIVVRHGDTELRVDEVVQPVDSPLSKQGFEQARDVATKLGKLDIDLMISSPLPRARDTANTINERLKREIRFSELLAEVKWPTKLEGLKTSDQIVKDFIKTRSEKNVSEPTWHYADEENFADLKKRAVEMLDWVKGLQKENILAISHSTFMKVFLTVMCHGENVTWPVYYNFLLFTRPKHTSISTFDLNKDGKWKLDTWNM